MTIKSHLGKNCTVTSGLMVSLGLTKHRLQWLSQPKFHRCWTTEV